MMRRFAFTVALVAVVIAAAETSARAQYGWGGWGGAGSTVQGSIAAGRGVAAAGAGQYNMETAAARSMNAQTAMQWNDYMYAINQRNSANEVKRLNQRQQKVNETQDATYKRLHDNPEPRDIHTGDALNVVLTELVNPKIYTQVVQKSKQPIDSNLVMNINFQYAANMILLCLEDVHSRIIPDALTDPRFESDRKAVRDLVAQGRKEAESSNQPAPETIRKLRNALTAAKDKADEIYANGTRQRTEVDNFLKGLIGLTKLLERPQVEQFLKGLKQYPQTTMGQLIDFMHGFNLRFGVAKTPEQEQAYDQIYPMLVQLRDQAQAGGPSPFAAAQAPLPDPRAATSVFSGLSYNQLQGQPGANPGVAPPPPPPGRPR
jgi:hypothetical protein